MRTYFAVLCWIGIVALLCAPAMAQVEKGATPQIAEDPLAKPVPSTMLPQADPQPVFAPLVDKRITRELATPLSLQINMAYPEIGLPLVDSHVAQWASKVVDNFQENVTKEAAPDDKTHYELQGKYTVSHPSAHAVSISYEIWTYTGGAHGNLDIITLNYATDSGAQLSLEDLFNDVEQALELMSTYCYSVLSAELSTDSTGSMLKSGTSPDAENFSALTLTPAGVIVHFQPYQVAPWASGPQQVLMNLDDLADAQPHWEVWGRGKKE